MYAALIRPTLFAACTLAMVAALGVMLPPHVAEPASATVVATPPVIAHVGLR